MPLHTSPRSAMGTGALLLICFAAIFPGIAAGQAETPPPIEDSTVDRDPDYQLKRMRGRVVFFAQELEDRFGIESVVDARQRMLALRTDDGHLIPLVENLRVRAFRTDERLRDMHVELLVRQYDEIAALHVIRVYEVQGEELYQVDYWCDVCAIVMFEQGACACCQEDNRLRKRKVTADSE